MFCFFTVKFQCTCGFDIILSFYRRIILGGIINGNQMVHASGSFYGGFCNPFGSICINLSNLKAYGCLLSIFVIKQCKNHRICGVVKLSTFTVINCKCCQPFGIGLLIVNRRYINFFNPLTLRKNNFKIFCAIFIIF